MKIHQGELELSHDKGNADGQNDYHRASADSRWGPNNLILDVTSFLIGQVFVFIAQWTQFSGLYLGSFANWPFWEDCLALQITSQLGIKIRGWSW